MRQQLPRHAKTWISKFEGGGSEAIGLQKRVQKQKAMKRLKATLQHFPVRTFRAAACPRRGRDVGCVHMQVIDGASVFIGWRNTNDLS